MGRGVIKPHSALPKGGGVPHGMGICLAVGGWLVCCEAVPCLQESKGH